MSVNPEAGGKVKGEIKTERREVLPPKMTRCGERNVWRKSARRQGMREKTENSTEAAPTSFLFPYQTHDIKDADQF